MTDTLTDLIRELRQRAKVYAMVGDKTPSGLMTRAADALESLNASVGRAAQDERNRIAAEIRDIGPDFDADDYVDVLEGRDPQDRYKGRPP